jgi:hypothetical protein
MTSQEACRTGHWGDCQGDCGWPELACDGMSSYHRLVSGTATASDGSRQEARRTGLREAIEFTAIPALLVFAEDNAGVREAIKTLRSALAGQPNISERDQLIADIRRRLPVVAIGHPDLAEQIGTTFDRLFGPSR